MRITLITLVTMACGFGQTSADFHFSKSETERQMQEIATVIRAITDIHNVAVDTGQKLLTVEGTSNQVVLADWLFNQLEKPQNAASHEYLIPGSEPDKVVHVFYVAHAETMQSFQEIATLIRSILDIRRLFTYSSPGALVTRGTSDQTAAAAWLLNNIDTPADVSKAIKRQYVIPPGGDTNNVVRVFYLSHTGTLQDFQQVATLIRTIGDIRRMFTYNAPTVIAMRGTAEQAALAEWMVQQLDQPPNAVVAGKREYLVQGPGDPDNVVRVFSLTHAETPQRLQEIGTQVRTLTNVRRLFTYNAPRIIALRGTPGQVEQADQLIRERDQ